MPGGFYNITVLKAAFRMQRGSGGWRVPKPRFVDPENPQTLSPKNETLKPYNFIILTPQSLSPKP